MPAALLRALVTGASKVITGAYAAGREAARAAGRARAERSW
jgi:hypothetical protein